MTSKTVKTIEKEVVFGHFRPETASFLCIKDSVEIDYVMANPPFNVDKVKSESAMNAGRLPFGIPSINAAKEFGNANYLWISYFYAYLNEKGRAGFVMASSATDSSGKDRDIRQKLVETGHVDVMMSVGNNFFYTKSLPCSIWFFDKGKAEAIQDKVLFIDARNYYTVVDRTLNEWSEWQLKNLNAIVWLYRGEVDKYSGLEFEYIRTICDAMQACIRKAEEFQELLPEGEAEKLYEQIRNTWKASTTVCFPNLYRISNVMDSLKDVCIASQKNTFAYYDAVRKESQLAFARGLGFKTYRECKKGFDILVNLEVTEIEECKKIINEAIWLYERFGDGKYQDIPGLCKLASRAEIAEKQYSLTPGAYVGVTPAKDDGVNFTKRMTTIHHELLKLQAESEKLMGVISMNLREMGL